jgi:hypothetical protein
MPSYTGPMPDTDAFGEERPRGLLARLFGSRLPTSKTSLSVRRSEILNLDVATGQVEAVQAAVDRWLRGYGVTAATTVEPREGGRSRIHAKLGEKDAAKLNLASEKIQSELQELLADALH